eukprot:2707128-Pyramimonas_sp.AAC.1
MAYPRSSISIPLVPAPLRLNLVYTNMFTIENGKCRAYHRASLSVQIWRPAQWPPLGSRGMGIPMLVL